MTIFDAILVGVIIAIALGVVAFLLWKAAGILNRLTAAVSNLAKLAAQVDGHLDTIQRELAFMRAMTGVNELPRRGVVNEPEPVAGVAPTRPDRPVEYPPTFLERFPKVAEPEPDAEVGDTDRELLEQSDDELKAAGILEELRQRGQDVEDSDVIHPGVEADAE